MSKKPIPALQLADDFALPLEALTDTFAILAMRGAGKSNTAAVMAESMFKLGLPFVVIDPVGSWFGLRSSSDGNAPGLPIPIFGGKRGDVPLERGGAALVADLVVDQRLTCILDLSTFESEAAKKTFLLAFAQRLYQRNEEPLHLFLEEADDYIPQRVVAGGEKVIEAQLLRAFENIVRRGRARGLGMTLITQRSAVLNKNVLTQTGTLIAMRTTSPQDREAVEAWIKYHAQATDILASLAQLESGEAWVWSPSFLRTCQRVKFYRRSTFDSGATPKITRGTRPTATLAQIDLASISERMAATIEKAKADDPKELKREIAELKKQLATVQKPDRPDLDEKVRTLGEANAELRSCLTAAQALLAKYRNELADIARRVTEARDSIEASAVSTIPKDVDPTPPQRTATPATIAPQRVERPSATSEPSGDVTGPQKRIIDVLASFEAMRLASVDKSTLALFANASPKSSGYANNLGALRSSGLIDYPAKGYVALTDAGRSIAERVDAPLTLEAYHSAWRERVSGPQWKILEAVISARLDGQTGVERTELASIVEASPTSSGFANNLGFLRNSLGLIEYPASGLVAAADRLFPEGLA